MNFTMIIGLVMMHGLSMAIAKVTYTDESVLTDYKLAKNKSYKIADIIIEQNISIEINKASFNSGIFLIVKNYMKSRTKNLKYLNVSNLCKSQLKNLKTNFESALNFSGSINMLDIPFWSLKGKMSQTFTN